MKESTVLDFVELRLSAPSASRCELYISAEGHIEKLACGFSKTFLSHLRTARELYSAGAGPILRLEGPLLYNGSTKPWFTKGTLERFIAYVSTPELLERVKTIEDELSQLEQVRNIQASSLPQVRDCFLNSGMALSRTAFVPPEYRTGFCHYTEGDNSKKELVRAMDARLSALQQEQNMVFSRAVAAGFGAESISDLQAFSDFFGADNLRVTCNCYYELLSKWQRANDKPAELSSQCSHETEAMELVSPQKFPERNDTLETKASVFSKELIHPQCPGSPDGLEDVSPVKRQVPTMKGLSHRISPRRRSASPLKKVQLGRFGSRRVGSGAIRSINYFSERQNQERNQDMDTSSSESEGNEKSCVSVERGSVISSSPAARRLSVQAAINLFERRQSKDASDIPGKQRSSKPQSRRASLDGRNAGVAGKFEQLGEGENSFGNGDCQESGVSVTTPDSDNRYGIQTFQSAKSTQSYTNRSSNEWPLENSSSLPGGCIQSGKGNCFPNQVLILGRGSSTSEDCFTSELDSIADSGRPQPVENDFSTAKSVITSASNTEKFADKRSMPAESRLLQLAPANYHVPMSVHEAKHSEGSEGSKPEQAISLLENESSSCEGNDVGNEECILSSDLSIQALASRADHSSVCQGSSSNEGRFYEHYRKLRDAKMMEEQKDRRAEREAKLRLMEETLAQRKAEMDARTAKLNKDGTKAQTRAAKLNALKANLREMQRMQDDGDIDHSNGQVSWTKDSSRSGSSPPSPPLTPRLVKEQALTPKLHRSKKAIAASQKATTPKSSTRAVSVSPKTTPRGTMRKVSSQPTVTSNVLENSVKCSVPCLTDLKKENARQFATGKHSSRAISNFKNTGSNGHPPASSRASLIDSIGTIPPLISSGSNTMNVDKRNRARTTTRLTNELMDSRPAPEEEILEDINSQKDVSIDGNGITKIQRNAIAPIQEVRPFLRKGTGIGPGAGPGLMKLKSEAFKSSDEDVPTTPTKTSDEEPLVNVWNLIDTDDSRHVNREGESADISAQCPQSNQNERALTRSLMKPDDITQHSEGLFGSYEDAKLEELSRNDGLSDNDRACHTSSFPIDLTIQERYGTTYTPRRDFAHQQVCRDVVDKREEGSATLSQLFSENNSHPLQNEPSVNGSASFRASLAIEEKNASRFSPLKATSLASSSLKRLGAAIPDYFSPSSAATIIDSPIGSPASWNASQVQYASETDANRAQKKFASQKPVVVIVPPKEPARGFKRLLKFGRKSRAAPEIIVMDGVSASTPSEGDDEAEEVNKGFHNYSLHDVIRKPKLQERHLRDFGIGSPHGGNGILSDDVPARSLQSAIPIPPSDFQLKYDLPPGTSKLKAPRSFFSLSAFRSRGSEGRSR